LNDRPTLQELREVQRLFGLPEPALVEKDWLVVRALAAISNADKGPFQLVFQGGTALSRAHRVIERMSEDIDIKIVSEGPPPRPALRRCGACAKASRASFTKLDSHSIRKTGSI
jgi:predicted nucleotidyltransferase component of viral defense system